ncbi:glycosyltransferase family 4 protein [Aeromonas veronii]|uniref:glycosyltransferase family 4 protein n=1 Tax=Aeromonas veronii TaxID=654 RepID=UPI003F7937CD
MISLYCNWKVKVTDSGFYISSVHAKYISVFKERDDVTLISNVTSSPVTNNDVFFHYQDIRLIPLPAFNSYVQALRSFGQIYISLKEAVKISDFIYVRTPEPFSWLIGLFNCVYKKTVNYHVTSNPLSVIWGNKSDSLIKRLIKSSIFYPEYIAILISSYFNKISCNGPSAIEELPFFIKNRVRVLIESTKRDCDFDENLIAKNFFSREGVVKLLVVTRFFPAKGIDVALEAFSKINFELTPCELFIAGDGPELNLMKKVAFDLGITERVNFLGNIKNGDELNQIYTQCHIFINPSLSETGPRVLLEAMAYNLYCISTDVGYSRHVLSDEHGHLYGHIISPGSVEEMQLSIQNAVINISNVMSIAEKGRALSKRFTLDKFVDHIISTSKH